MYHKVVLFLGSVVSLKTEYSLGHLMLNGLGVPMAYLKDGLSMDKAKLILNIQSSKAQNFRGFFYFY